jgi:hypothetical protein
MESRLEVANYRAAESKLGGFMGANSLSGLDSRLRGNDGVLVALMAESDPEDKEVLICLIMNMLAGAK